jgi:predicted ABC-type ATPase
MVLDYAGPTGSGKSTFISHLGYTGEYTNADDVVASTGMSNIDAAKFVDEKRYQAIKEGRDFTFETVLSSTYKMDLLRTAKRQGYFIKCFFILTKDPNLNVARVKARVLQGGHDVDPDKIKARYLRSLANIKELLEICDILHVYDNTLNEPRRIIRKHKEDISLFPNSIWSLDELLKLVNGSD